MHVNAPPPPPLSRRVQFRGFCHNALRSEWPRVNEVVGLGFACQSARVPVLVFEQGNSIHRVGRGVDPGKRAGPAFVRVPDAGRQ